MKPRRLLLVEDHVLVRAGLRALLEHTLPDIEVVGEADNGSEALKLIPQLHPDVVLMDITMPVLNGIETTRRAIKQNPRTRVLIVSVHAEKDYVRQALVAGASGYIVKSATEHEFALAIAAVLRGEVWISPAVAQTVVDEVLRAKTNGSPTEELTPRQREVLQLVAEGHSTKQIARRLHLSVKTVETHRAQIMQRLDVRNVAGLVRYAIRNKIVSGD